MGAKHFHFKQFSIADDRCTHKVGTDGVLLGAWVNIRQHDKFLLDIGTGSGLIALMLAQRSIEDVHIDAIELEEMDAQQARENVAASPWPQKVTVIAERAEKFASTTHYDLIVSNPPYFLDSLLPPAENRRQARHALSLPFDDLLKTVERLLSPHGRFAVILPYTEGMHFIKLAGAVNLFPFRKSTFRSRRHKPIERIMIELSRERRMEEESEIILYDGETWSAGYRELTRDFYLKA